MIKFIYDNRIIQLFTLILGVVILRVLIFQTQEYSDLVLAQRGVFRHLINNVNAMPWLSFSLSTLLVLIQGLLLGQIVFEYNIVDRPGYSILFFYGLLTAMFHGTLLLSYVTLGVLFLLLGFLFLYRYLKGQYKRQDLFVTSLFMGIAALSVPEFFWSMVFLLLIVLIFKATEAGEVFVIVFGILIPYYLISSIGYLASTELNFKSILKLWNLNLVEIPNLRLSSLDLIVIVNLLLVGVFGAFKVFGSYFRYNVDARRSRLAMGFIGIFLLLIFGFKYNHYQEFFVCLCLPLSVYTANLFQIERPSFLWRFLFYGYVLGLISYPFL